MLAELPTAGRDSELAEYLGPHGATLPGAAGRGPLDRQRDGGGGVQDGHRQAAEADRGAVEARRLERMAALCCLGYGDQFDAYWRRAAG